MPTTYSIIRRFYDTESNKNLNYVFCDKNYFTRTSFNVHIKLYVELKKKIHWATSELHLRFFLDGS